MSKIFNKFNLTLNIWISLIINVVLCIVLTFVATGGVTLGGFLFGFIIAFPVSTLIVLFIPVTRFGDFIAAKCGLKPRSVPFTLVSTAVLARTLLLEDLYTSVSRIISPNLLPCIQF